jgi:hypothetical protein
MYFYNASTAVANKLNTPTTLARVYAFNSSTLHLTDFATRYLRIYNSSIVNLSNSTPYYLRSYGDAAFNIFNSTIQKQYSFDASNVTVTQTDYVVDFRTYDISTFTAFDSSIEALVTCNKSICRMVNSTYDSNQILDQSVVYVWWYLDVHVADSISQDVPSANVTVTFSNGTIAESKLTDIYGWVRSTLMETKMNSTGAYPIGNYAVNATFEAYTASTPVDMTENRQIAMYLLFIIPEFPSPTILTLAMLVSSLVLWIWQKNRKQSI